MSICTTRRTSTEADLYGKEHLVGVARILLEEPREELEVGCAKVVRVELAAVQKHLHACRESVDSGLDGLEGLLIRDGTGAAPAARRN